MTFFADSTTSVGIPVDVADAIGFGLFRKGIHYYYSENGSFSSLGTATRSVCNSPDQPGRLIVSDAGTSVPDPGSSLLLLGMGLAGLTAWRKRLGFMSAAVWCSASQPVIPCAVCCF
jgi:hypothetical protein